MSHDAAARVLVIGLGTIGLPIALGLHAAGFAVSGIDPVPAARDALTAGGARAIAAGSLRDAVQALCRADTATASSVGGERVTCLTCVTCVSDEDALLQLWHAPGGLRDALRPGLLLIDHTTTGVATARRLASDAASAGATWLDAPLSGAEAGARAGTLSAMLGGEPGAVAQARPVLAAYCATLSHLGPAGAGQAAKLANQLAIAGTNLGLLAAAGFAAAAGLDLARCFDALAAGSAHSMQLDQHRDALVRAPHDVAHFDWLRRDLARVRDHLASKPFDPAHVADPYLQDMQAMQALQALHHRLFTLSQVFDGTPASPLL